MTLPRVCVACSGGVLALVTLSYGILHGSADAWRLFLSLIPPLIVFIWWMIDRATLERRIRRLEARSEIADERRITAQTGITEVEHKLKEIEGRDYGAMIVEKVSRYYPDSQIPVVVTDGESKQFSVGVRQTM